MIDQSSLKMTNKSSILVICGPTASGKTSLSLEIAKLLPKANILSADSRQIYSGLDILTGKDIPENIPDSIKIYGLDIVEADLSFNLADFVQYAQSIIRKSLDEKTPLIIVGGTGLYLKAITSNLLNVHIPPNQKIRRELEKKDLASLQKILLKLNPEKLKSMNNSDLHNPRRLIRAIEISKGQTPGVSSSRESCLTPPYFLWIGLNPDKDTLKENIRLRVLERIDSGAVDEVKNLIKNNPDKNHPVFTSLGVREIKDYLDQKISREQLIDLWTKAEIDYARRQIVWFKKQTGIVWYDRSSIENKLISNLAKIVYQDDKK